MCGIFGYVGASVPSPSEMENALNTLEHRGPDAYGIYADYDAAAKLWMGHRRLSILDLSEAAKQPFVTPDKKVAISVNGEIYNFQELRTALEAKGAEFKSHSDSEVLLWGFYYEGEAFFKKIRGIFAAAIWDRKWSSSPRLLLIRDRIGVKPLYYHIAGKNLTYASELKAITALPDFHESVSEFGRDQYFVFGYIPAPLSIYENTYKLLPGEYIIFENGNLKKEIYWQIEIPKEKFKGSLPDAENELDRLLNDSIKEELISDVPLGAFLSGGIDSSIVCAIIQKHVSRPLKTFTIGFDSKEYDESGSAEKIAKYLGTDHLTAIMSEKDLQDIFPKIFDLYDEPFYDSSALPTTLLSGITKKQVSVALSGDGGDELFFGYNSFPKHRQIAQAAMLPYFLRKPAGFMLHSIFRNRRIGYMGNALMFDSFADAYLFPSGLFHRVFYQQLRQKNYPIRQSQLYKFYTHLKKSVPLKDMGAYLDACSYLPDDVLCKVDRASMSYALEVRVPILDHRIMEFAASLPSEMKYTKSRGGKIVLKNLLEKYIPRDLWDRPKQGFGAPVKKWLRNELKTVMLDYLSPDMLKQETYLNNDFIQKRIQDHLSGTKDNASFLWNLLLWMMWNQNKKK